MKNSFGFLSYKKLKRASPDAETGPQNLDYVLPELDLPSSLEFDHTIRRYGIDYSYAEIDSDSSDEDEDIFGMDPVVESEEHEGLDVITPLSIHRGATRHSIVRTPTPGRRLSVSNPPSRPLSRTASRMSRRSQRSIRKSNPDPNLVSWDSKDDPANPHNWPKIRRWLSMVLVSLFTFVSPMASTMVAPALPTIGNEFRIDSEVELYLVMSIFLLAYAIGPFLWGPLSEVFGRVRVLQIANAIFLLFNTVCGFSKTKEQMMAFRFLSGIGGSAPQAIGGGVLSDLFRADQRGTAISIYSLFPFIGPAIGPIAGGYLTQYVSWRWVFWVTSIFDALVQLLAILFLKETYTPVLLAKKVVKLKKETGNPDLHTKWQGPDHSMRKLLMKSLVRPFIMLSTQPALQSMALFRAYQYGLMYLALATFPLVFEGSYGQDTGTASLNYLSLGIGFVAGLQISGPMQDKIYAYCKEHTIDPSASIFSPTTWGLTHLQRKSRSEKVHVPVSTDALIQRIPRKPVNPNPIPPSRRVSVKSFTHDPTKALPEYRLPLILPTGLLIPIGLFIYGWAAEKRVHWIVPNIGACIFAIGLIMASI
ncbi:hypothetical protein ABW19_dt0205560 [Dactylella cylindrospora]|nr:hypothetical protein ABW19_dt0205560 [Dactylella cylindrospora]